MAFVFNDGGRAMSKRPRQTQDCVVRSIALVTGENYDSVYDTLAERGRKCGRSTAKKVWQKYLNELPNLKRTSYPAEKGVLRMNLYHFALTHKAGRFIVQCAGHLTTVMNGDIYDTFEPRMTACVYAVWQLAE